MATDRRRTGEGHEFRDRARDEVVGDVGRDTEDEIEHPVGEAGVFERLSDVHSPGRGFLRSFQNDRTAAREGTSDLAGGLAHREIPR